MCAKRCDAGPRTWHFPDNERREERLPRQQARRDEPLHLDIFGVREAPPRPVVSQPCQPASCGRHLCDHMAVQSLSAGDQRLGSHRLEAQRRAVAKFCNENSQTRADSTLSKSSVVPVGQQMAGRPWAYYSCADRGYRRSVGEFPREPLAAAHGAAGPEAEALGSKHHTLEADLLFLLLSVLRCQHLAREYLQCKQARRLKRPPWARTRFVPPDTQKA